MKNNKNTEKKSPAASRFRFNVIDVLIIVMVLVCIGGVVLRYTVLDEVKLGGEMKDYYITFTVSDISYAQLSHIVQAKDETESHDNWVYLSDGITKLGALTAVGEQNKESFVYKNDKGESISAVYSDRESDEDVPWSLTGKILCRGRYSKNGGFLLNGKQFISPNTELDVYMKYCDFTLKIVDISESLE